jgi:hypothetical protein
VSERKVFAKRAPKYESTELIYQSQNKAQWQTRKCYPRCLSVGFQFPTKAAEIEKYETICAILLSFFSLACFASRLSLGSQEAGSNSHANDIYS